MKRILSSLLIVIICIGFLPSIEVSATDQNMNNPRITDYTDNQFYIEKLGVLFDKLVNNQYNYFTTTGKTCGNSECSSCDTGNVTRQHPTISYLNVDYPIGETNSCYGFAKWTFKYLYGIDANGVLDNPNSRGNTNTTTVVSSTYYGNYSSKEVIRQAKIGDILQSPRPHSMIFLKCDDDYFYVLHANWKWKNEGNNIVKVSKFSYDQFDKITVYRANNYSDYEHTCTNYETYKNGSTKVLGACKECHEKYDYSKVSAGDIAGLWIAKKNEKINLYNEPYEDATYTSVRSGELEVTGYVKNAYGNKWYVISGDKNKTYYVYEKTFKNLYTQDLYYYENEYHKYESGAVIENQNSNNNAENNNGLLGNSTVGIVDIPSSWENLSIRSGPSTNYQIVGSMNDGARCNVYPNKTKNGWYYVEYNGIYGYASGNQINTSGSSDPTPSTPTPSTPPTISFSKSQLNLDYNSHPSETITVTALGALPSQYHLYYKFDSALSVTSGQWNGNSISMTIEMKGGPVKDNKIEVYLKDSSDNVYATNTIYVNATVPIIKQNTEIVLSKDNISIHFPDKQSEKMFVTIEGPILDNSTISIDTNESVTFEWGKWSNNRAELTIQSSRTIPANYTPCGYATIYIKDGNGNIYASKQFNLTSTVAKYAVRYDANGGYDAPDTHYIYHNHWDERVSSHIPKREGYKFEGWSTSRNGKVEYGPSQQLMKDHDIVFYAVWEKIEDLFSLEFDDYSIHDDTFETVEYYIDGDRFLIDDIVFQCDKNIECDWGMVKNEDGRFSIILQIIRNGDISSHELSFDVVNEDGYILFSDTLSVFENYDREQFSDKNTSGITVYVDGEKIDFDVQPQIINDRTMVPMRAIFEALGADVYWDGDTQTVYGETYDTSIEIAIGEAYLLKNNKYVELDSPAVIVDGRTLVPVRAIAESLNCQVEWVDSAKMVNIRSLPSDYSESAFESTNHSGVKCNFSNFNVFLDTSWGDDELFWGFNYVCNVNTVKCGVEIWNKRTGKHIEYEELTNPAYREVYINSNQMGSFSRCIGSIGSFGDVYTLELGETYEWIAYVYDAEGNKHCSDVQEYTFTGKGSRFLD